MSTQSKIYVICLASYSKGIKYGKWISLNQDLDDVWKDVDEMLKTVRSRMLKSTKCMTFKVSKAMESLTTQTLKNRINMLNLSTNMDILVGWFWSILAGI